MLIGITGQIGSGKSTVARILLRLGAAVIDADLIGHDAVEQSVVLKRKLARAFGPEVLDARGQIRRKKLAALAFAGKESKATLDSLVHPYLLRELRSRVRNCLRTHKVVVIDAALLMDWGMEREMDFVLVVHASRANRLRRLKRRGIFPEAARARERSQLPFQQLKRRADRVILNNDSQRDLEGKVVRLFRQLLSQTD